MTEAVSSRLDELRRAFDGSFALPPAAAPETPENLLAVRIAGERYALRVSELTGLHPHRRVVPLAGARAGLLGIAGVRGRLVPVYSLAGLLGHAAGDDDEDSWLALCGRQEPVALAFTRFDGHRQPPRSALLSLPAGESARHLRQSVRLDGAMVPIVDLASILQRIQN